MYLFMPISWLSPVSISLTIMYLGRVQKDTKLAAGKVKKYTRKR